MPGNAATTPLVSVVIPTYNRPHFLREAIASALAQTYANIEVLIRDNASTDETRQVVQSFSDPRIKYLRHERNIGPTQNVIGGCRDSAGIYVANLHDDDVWEPDFVEKLVAPLEADPSIAIAFSDHHIIDAAGQIDPAMSRKNTAQWQRDTLPHGRICPIHRIAVVARSIPLSMAAIMRRSAIDWNDVPGNLPSCYDLWLMYLVCREGQAAYFLPERLTRYRVHEGSETASGRMRVDQGYVMCFERMLQDERMKSVWPELRLEMARACTDLGITLARSGRALEGRPFLRRSLQYHWTLRGATLYGMTFAKQLIRKQNGHSVGGPVVPKTPLPLRSDS